MLRGHQKSVETDLDEFLYSFNRRLVCIRYEASECRPVGSVFDDASECRPLDLNVLVDGAQTTDADKQFQSLITRITVTITPPVTQHWFSPTWKGALSGTSTPVALGEVAWVEVDMRVQGLIYPDNVPHFTRKTLRMSGCVGFVEPYELQAFEPVPGFFCLSD